MPAPIQEKHHPSPVTSGAHTLTFDNAVTSGSAVIACVAGPTSTLGDHSVVITDNHGNTLDEVLWHVDSGGRTAIQYAMFGHGGGSTTLTFTWTRISTGMPDTVDVTCGIIEAPVAGVGSVIGATSGNSTTHQASNLTNVEDDALFLCVSNSGTNLGAITPGDGYTGYFNTDALIVNYKSVVAPETNDASFTSAVTGRCSHAFVVYEGVFTPIDGFALFGENGSVSSSRTVLFNQDGVTRTVDEPDTVAIYGTLKVNGVEITAGAVSPTTTKGDIIARSATVDDRLPIGSNGQVLTADSAETLGVKWATPSAGGGTVSALDIGRLAYAMQGLAVYSGCAVTEDNTGASMDVDVAAGHIRTVAGVGVLVTAGEVTLDAADATNPRIDVVWVNTSATLGKTTGTAASDPQPPAIPSNSVVLAIVSVPANDTTIETAQITDKRTYTKLPQLVRKTANEDVTSSTVLQDDNELKLTVGASEIWMGRLVLFYDGNDSPTPDFKMEFTIPSGATSLRGVIALPTAATQFFNTTMDALMGGQTGGTVNTGFAGGLPWMSDCMIVNSTTPGTWQLQWAQNTSSGTRTRVRLNSYFWAMPQF